MIKSNNLLTLSGNIIIERDPSVSEKIDKMNAGHVVEFKRCELSELSNNSVTSKSFFNDDVFLAGVRGFCFFPERPELKFRDLPAHFVKYTDTVFFNSDPSGFMEYFDFCSGYFEHHQSIISSRFLDSGSVDFIAFHAKRTKLLTLFLDLVFIDSKSCFTAIISCAGNGDVAIREVFSVEFNLNALIGSNGLVDSSASLIFNTLTSCLVSLISMDYSLFCSCISESTKDVIMSIQLENFNKVVKNDLLLSGLSEDNYESIDKIKSDMFLFFSKVIDIMLK